jgi:hypothetical protein
LLPAHHTGKWARTTGLSRFIESAGQKEGLFPHIKEREALAFGFSLSLRIRSITGELNAH